MQVVEKAFKDKPGWFPQSAVLEIENIDAEIDNARNIIDTLTGAEAEAAEEAGVRMVAALGEDAG